MKLPGWIAPASLSGCLLLTACGSPPTRDAGIVPTPDKDFAPTNPRDVSHVQDAVPRKEPRSRYGNPPSYVVMGKTYLLER